MRNVVESGFFNHVEKLLPVVPEIEFAFYERFSQFMCMNEDVCQILNTITITLETKKLNDLFRRNFSAIILYYSPFENYVKW